MKRVLLIVIILLQYGILLSQKFTLSASKTQVQTNERIQLAFAFDGGSIPQNVMPKVNGMMVVGGPMQSSSSSTYNGVTTSKTEVIYEVIFTKAGTTTIPAVTIQNKKGKFTSNALSIKVVKGKNSGSLIPAQYEGKELIIVMQADHKKVFLGEPVAIDLVVYSIFNNMSITSFDFPAMDGGWTKDAVDAFNGQLTATTYKGLNYYKCTLKRVWMVPSILGKVEFKPVSASFACMLQDPDAGLLQYTFDEKSEPVQFDVVDLPLNKRPESFINAVGDFTWTVELDRTQAKANEPIKAIIKVNGTGNMPTLEPPVLDLSQEFEVFEPNTKNNYKVEIKGVNGTKQFEYLIMPRKEGEYTLGPFRFSYFNTVTGKYTELVSDSFKVNIKGIAADTTGSKTVINNGKFTGEKLKKKSDPFFGRPLYYVLLGLPFLMGLGMILFRKRLFFTKKDDSEKKSRQAEDKANKGLNEAKIALSSGKTEALGLLSAVFFQYIGDKFKVTKNEITRANLEKWLSPDVWPSAKKIMDQLDQFRFAPAAQSDLDSLFINIKSLVDELGK